MASPTSLRWLQALGLAAPLLGIAAWLVTGALSPAPVPKMALSTHQSSESRTLPPALPADGPAKKPSAPTATLQTTTPSLPVQQTPRPAPAPVSAKPAETAAPETENPWASFAVPTSDFPAGALEDRVDGAAEFLRSLGCYRLIYWRSETPPAEFELLVFKTGDGAHAALERDAGSERTSGPGDEAQISPQAIYFRRGPYFARLFLDPEAKDPEQSLKHRAATLDKILAKGVQL